MDGVATLLEKNKVDIFKGHGRILSPTSVRVESGEEEVLTLETSYIIAASGSVPRMVPIQGLQEYMDSGRILTSTEILDMDTIPEKLTIIGGGVIGMEFATIFNQFGSDVTVLEALDSILPSFHGDLVKRYKSFPKKQGIDIKVKTFAKSISVSDEKVTVQYEGAKDAGEVISDYLLMAVGRKSNTEGLGLDDLGVDPSAVDGFMKSAEDTIYCIGDLNGMSMLAHSASKQGVIAANDIAIRLGLEAAKLQKLADTHKPFDAYHVPNCAFLLPEIAETTSKVWQSEYADDKKKVRELKEGTFNYRSNGMAKALNQEDGLSKVYLKDNQLIYMGLLGASATELIMEGVHMMDHHAGPKDWDSIVGHPSLGEIIHESLLDSLGLAIHKI